MNNLPEKKNLAPTENDQELADNSHTTRTIREWMRRIDEEAEALTVSEIALREKEANEYQNYLTNQKGWAWDELLCELENLVKKKSPAAFNAWHKVLQAYATKNGFDAWKARKTLQDNSIQGQQQ